MSKVVADASFCGAWIFPDEASRDAELLLQDVLDGSRQLVVPSLWYYEMANMLRSGHLRGRLTKSGLKAALEAIRQVPVSKVDVPKGASTAAMCELALKFELSSYDAAYLEISTRLQVPLLTCDSRLAQVFEKLSAGSRGLQAT